MIRFASESRTGRLPALTYSLAASLTALLAVGCTSGGAAKPKSTSAEAKEDIVRAPDLRRVSLAEARRELVSRGLQIVVTRRRSNDVAKGVVETQSPGAGKKLARGARITVVVSKGSWPKPLASGRYRGMTSQGKPISFRISRDGTSVRGLSFLVVMTRCGTGAYGSTFTSTVTAPFAAEVLETGRLHSLEIGNVVFRGAFRSSRFVSGILRTTSASPDFPHCASGWVRWSARLAG